MLLVWFDSWRSVLVFEAVIAIVATIAWVIVWNTVEQPESAQATAIGAAEGSFRRLLVSREIQRILFVAFTLFFVTHALGNWLPTVLEELSGLSPTAAGGWVAAGGIVAIGAGATVPAYATPERMHLLVAAVLAITAAGVVSLVVTPGAWHGPLSLIMAVRGSLIGLAIVTLLAADRVTAANTGVANGLWFSAAEVGGVTGPLTVGALADSSLGYEGALLAVAGIGFLGVIVSVTAQRHRSAVASDNR